MRLLIRLLCRQGRIRCYGNTLTQQCVHSQATGFAINLSLHLYDLDFSGTTPQCDWALENTDWCWASLLNQVEFPISGRDVAPAWTVARLVHVQGCSPSSKTYTGTAAMYLFCQPIYGSCYGGSSFSSAAAVHIRDSFL